MSAFAAIPKTAPFSEDEVDLLNRVVGPASPVQRAWLSGFLAGVEQGTAGARNPPRRRGRPSRSPSCSRAKAAIARSSPAMSRRQRASSASSPPLVDMADLDVATLAKAKRLVVIAATWGEGEPPARAARVYDELMGDGAPRLDGVEFGVLALGDTAYAEFCAIGKKIDERLAALGAKRVADRVDCDLDFAEPAAQLDRRRAQGAGAAGRLAAAR